MHEKDHIAIIIPNKVWRIEYESTIVLEIFILCFSVNDEWDLPVNLNQKA